MKKQNLTEELNRMKVLAGLINENINETEEIDEVLEEGLRSWIAGGLIALTTLAGVGKVYQLDKEHAENEKIEMKFYDDVLSGQVSKMNKEQLATLGAEINDKTHDLTWGKNYSNEELNDILSNYASKYVKSHPKQFSVDTQGNLQFTM